MQISEFKSHFHYSPAHRNFNNAGQANIPDVNQKIVQNWTERFYKEGALCAMEGWRETENVRTKLANFLGADVSETAFFQTTASALSQAAFGIPLRAGDEILTWDQEYPSNFYPWRVAAEKAGAKVVQVASTDWQTPAAHLLAQVTPKTKVVAVSWVQYQTGAVTDLKFISEQLKGRGIWLVADIIQGAGVRPFHFHDSGFDIVCGGSHKWMCSGYGAGFMLVKNERLVELEPNEVGAMTYGDPDTIKSFTLAPKKTAHRFEAGSKALVEVLALGATLDLFNSAGIRLIYDEACRVADRLRAGLKERAYVLHCNGGPIVNFSGKNIDTLENIFTAERTAYAKRGPGLRLSLHAYNRDEELSDFFKIIDRL